MNIRSTILAVVFVTAAATIAAASGGLDGAVIENSGSTNAPGYTIKLWSDGHAAVAGAGTRVPADLVQRFFNDVRLAKRGRAGEAPVRGCMKSASFGSSTIVRYHGWTSADLECPGFAGLSADARGIAAAAHGAASVRPIVRRPMLPGEHRRPEASPATQPSASPESAGLVP